MKPYYEHAGITIYHGDCREILPAIRRTMVGVTDPPYGCGVKYGVYRADLRAEPHGWKMPIPKRVRIVGVKS